MERAIREHAAGEGEAEDHLPLTLVLIFGLLYLNTRSSFKAGVVMLAVPFSAVGAIWLLYVLGYNVSIAVWVGMIGSWAWTPKPASSCCSFSICHTTRPRPRGQLRTTGDLVESIIHGAVKRVRPKAMTVCAAFIGLLPIMWSTGTGADLMKRIAAPMVGGLVTSFAMELLVYPRFTSCGEQGGRRRTCHRGTSWQSTALSPGRCHRRNRP